MVASRGEAQDEPQAGPSQDGGDREGPATTSVDQFDTELDTLLAGAEVTGSELSEKVLRPFTRVLEKPIPNKTITDLRANIPHTCYLGNKYPLHIKCTPLQNSGSRAENCYGSGLAGARAETPRSWATEVEIFATATLLNTPIWIFAPYGKNLRWLKYAPLLDIGVWERFG